MRPVTSDGSRRLRVPITRGNLGKKERKRKRRNSSNIDIQRFKERYNPLCMLFLPSYFSSHRVLRTGGMRSGQLLNRGCKYNSK